MRGESKSIFTKKLLYTQNYVSLMQAAFFVDLQTSIFIVTNTECRILKR